MCNVNGTENLVTRKVRLVIRFMWAKPILSDEHRHRFTEMNSDGAVRVQRSRVLFNIIEPMRWY
jgi:hypothetical protein